MRTKQASEYNIGVGMLILHAPNLDWTSGTDGSLNTAEKVLVVSGITTSDHHSIFRSLVELQHIQVIKLNYLINNI